MLIPVPLGGLGNVMFELASVYSIAKQTGHSFGIYELAKHQIAHSTVDATQTILSPWLRYRIAPQTDLPIFIPWSPVCVAAAIATSSIDAGSTFGFRSSNPRIARTIRSSARVPAYMPPAFPKGVRTASTRTTVRDMELPLPRA